MDQLRNRLMSPVFESKMSRLQKLPATSSKYEIQNFLHLFSEQETNVIYFCQIEHKDTSYRIISL